MNRTKIEYLDFSWNPIVGCSGIGCTVREVCWARAMAKRQKQRCQLCYQFVPHLHQKRLDEPLHRKKPTRIGVSFMGDLFDTNISFRKRIEVLEVIEKASWHTFIALTKQPQNILFSVNPPNLCVGVSVNRKDDLWRIERLKKTLVKVKAVSFEPLYEDMGDIDLDGIDWIIIGAQTRPTLQPDSYWVWSLTNEAKRHNIPVFHKNNLAYPNKLQEFPVVI